jgi:hypothetical protein
VVTQRAGTGAVRPLATIAHEDVDGGQIAALGHLHFLIRGKTIIHAGVQFGMIVDGALDGFREGHGLGLGTDHGQQNATAERCENTHEGFLLDV